MVQDIITGVANQYGLDPNAFYRAAQIESSLNPSAKNSNSSAGGLFQQIDSNWNQYGNGGDRYDPQQSADAAARYWLDNQRYLKNSLGRDLEGWEMYLAHQQGPGGAEKILSADPNARAVDVLGSKQVTLNGGTEDMTVGEFAGLWRNKFEGGGRYVGPGESPQVLLEGDFLPPTNNERNINDDAVRAGLALMGLDEDFVYKPWLDPEVPPALNIRSKTDDFIFNVSQGNIPDPAVTLGLDVDKLAESKKKEEAPRTGIPAYPGEGGQFDPGLNYGGVGTGSTGVLETIPKAVGNFMQSSEANPYQPPRMQFPPSRDVPLDPSKVTPGSSPALQRPTRPGEIDDPNIQGQGAVVPQTPAQAPQMPNSSPQVRPVPRPSNVPQTVAPALSSQNTQQTPNMGRRISNFFGSQRGQDAMLAIGAGLLSGNNWHDGLGAGAQNMIAMQEEQRDRQHQKELLDTREAGALARTQIAGSTPQYIGNVRLKDGSIVGGVTRRGGKYFDASGQDISDQFDIEMNNSDSYGTKGQMSMKQASDFAKDLVQQRNTLETFDKVLGHLEDVKYGVPGLITDLQTTIRTLKGRGDLTEDMLNRKLTQAELQGLIGRAREEVVGPGVMTEQDAMRIVMALGGDLQSILSNPEVSIAQITRMREKNLNTFNQQFQQYDRMVDAYGNVIPYQRVDPYLAPETTLDQSNVGPDEGVDDILKEYGL